MKGGATLQKRLFLPQASDWPEAWGVHCPPDPLGATCAASHGPMRAYRHPDCRCERPRHPGGDGCHPGLAGIFGCVAQPSDLVKFWRQCRLQDVTDETSPGVLRVLNRKTAADLCQRRASVSNPVFSREEACVELPAGLSVASCRESTREGRRFGARRPAVPHGRRRRLPG